MRLDPRHRTLPSLDANAVRGLWATLIADAGAVAARAVASDGVEVLEPLEFKAVLARIDRASFPVADASAAGLSQAFLLLARAMLNAATPRRRAVLGPALLAAARAVDDVLSDARAEAAQATWMRQMGPDG